MKHKRILLSILLLAALTSVWAKEVRNLQSDENIQITQEPKDDYINYTVITGDNVYSIARKYKTTVDEIYRLNPDAKNGIKAGQVIKIPKTNVQTSTSYIEYTVKKGETLYSISRVNETTVETICSLNPQAKDGLKKGMVLKIPKKRIKSAGDNPITPVKIESKNPKPTFIEHKVKKGETIYSLCKTYNISAESLLTYNPDIENKGLKTGSKVRIPNNLSSETNALGADGIIQNPRYIKANDPIKIGIIFPFLDKKSTVQKEKLIEYYEGFLLAVKKMKEVGVDAEIYTFDTGIEKDTKRLKNILETSEVNNLHLVIGGTSQAQIDMLTDFSQKTGIRYVIPFGVKKNMLQNSPNVFQITTSHSDLFNDITKEFVNKFRLDNIIFVTEQGSNMNRNDFVSALKKILDSENITYKDLKTGDKIVEDMKSAMDKNKNNVLIPTSSSEVTLRKITGVLDLVPNGTTITLFGYPEWQTYLGQTSQLHKYNTYIYSSFYLNEGDPVVKEVMDEYKKWYNKNIALSFPRFAFLGYDAGLFFISNLNKYKNKFDKDISQISSPTLQTSIHFYEEKEGSGYQNIGFYFVNFKKDGTIEKIDYK